MHSLELSIDSFNYILPPERIAQFPLEQRDQSKLLIYRNGNIAEKKFESLIEELPENSLLVFNDTKVIQARLLFKTSTDAHIELFLLEPVEPHTEMRLAVTQQSNSVWRCFVGNAKRWRGEVLHLKGNSSGKEIILSAELVGNESETFLVRLQWEPEELTFAEMISSMGHVPLPPYIKRHDESEDKSSYQTIFSHEEGSVAAPTAGLHFTKKIFDGLKEKNISTEFLTLHVGAGTFLPVKSSTIGNHVMHAERVYVKKSTIEGLLQQLAKGKIISVGTTSLRTLESLYWFGKQLFENKNRDEVEEMNVTQWEPYPKDKGKSLDICPSLSSLESLNAILQWMIKKEKTEFTGYTQIMIVPGYEFKMVDALITNFHLPKSTLLLLIAAFIGDDWKRIYDYALKNEFRFLSYGDSSLLFRNHKFTLMSQ